MSANVKTCRVCGQSKPTTEFYKRKDSPDGFRNDCRACKDAQQKRWDEKNRESLRAYKRQYYRDNYMGTEEQKEKAQRWNARYYARDPEAQRRRVSAYWKSERGVAVKRAYNRKSDVMAANRERARRYYATGHGQEVRRKYKAENKHRVNEDTRRRRARRRENGGRYSRREWVRLLELCGGRCVSCGTTESITVDHIVPVSKGGSGYIDNIQPLCLSCNSSKNNNTVDYRSEETRQWAISQKMARLHSEQRSRQSNPRLRYMETKAE